MEQILLVSIVMDIWFLIMIQSWHIWVFYKTVTCFYTLFASVCTFVSICWSIFIVWPLFECQLGIFSSMCEIVSQVWFSNEISGNFLSVVLWKTAPFVIQHPRYCSLALYHPNLCSVNELYNMFLSSLIRHTITVIWPVCNPSSVTGTSYLSLLITEMARGRAGEEFKDS